MTYGEIKERVVNVTHSAHTLTAAHFSELAKGGVADIISHIPICISELYILRESVIDMCRLQRPCFEVRSVRTAEGEEIPFKVLTASQYIDVPYWVRECYIYYRYIPYRMRSYGDTPDIPKELHELLFLYIVAQHCKDEDVQAAMNLYEKRRDGAAAKYKESFLLYE